ncbi:hypothetical protein [Listeria costaricensis]|uniref:hypothetical protein n=1 Tax=Listeria costaricensis TaxID=2026604 RepID=UPI000C072AB2|nr:hypothetical protein [Listeria costaricensis]
MKASAHVQDGVEWAEDFALGLSTKAIRDTNIKLAKEIVFGSNAKSLKKLKKRGWTEETVKETVGNTYKV